MKTLLLAAMLAVAVPAAAQAPKKIDRDDVLTRMLPFLRPRPPAPPSPLPPAQP